MKVRLSVNNIIKRLVVHDVIGVIRGSVEPDQFSVTGNHHDAWGFGASDPSSGTAALLEASRTLGDMVRRGWRPRRSIVVAFWAQEEFGMGGSREWVEENIDLITHGAVGYVNLDICAQGSLFGAAASPSLRNIIYKANEVFPVAGNSCGHATNDCQRVDISSYIGLSGAGSDNIAFNLFAGVPSVDFYFTPDPVSNFTFIYFF
ncbi:probable glutamate carboxypeptidase LAMP1 [Ixodes scapularis]|uniref:probable glutamate carboxypeptidase LAMP1 n=1 Tax=Ixodes scapularis TaxID=6945 RepID=UPI001A9CE585|nr:probable glutamate carboxypeptidase LAMP1 [Ixodes scapularis]